ncbi:LamG domain-containing protein [Catenuloplanes sp. NPDC051500]|uniref:LamG domain-containing protein n=1 Tax=Catenuloplanes sp. NPDC051500 TaxID=3363959 RepID=UPI0037AEF0C6
MPSFVAEERGAEISGEPPLDGTADSLLTIGEDQSEFGGRPARTSPGSDGSAVPGPAARPIPVTTSARRKSAEDKPALTPIELMLRRDSRRRRGMVAGLAAGALLIGLAAFPTTRALLAGELDPAPSPTDAAPAGPAGSAPPQVRAPRVAPPDGVTGGLALRWAADEGTGRVAGDGSNAANPALLSAAAGWEAAGHDGKGSALRLSASTPESYAAGARAAVRTDRSFTVMTWVYLTDRRADRGVLSQPGVVSSGFVLRYDKASDSWRVLMPRADASDPVVDVASSTSTPKLRTWTHLAAAFDAATGRVTLYVDGRAEGSAPHPERWQATGAIQAGRARVDTLWTDPFGGALDDVRAYNRSLTAAEIATIAE